MIHLKKFNPRSLKYPEVPAPKTLKFTNNEIGFVRHTLCINSRWEAENVLREKFYGQDKPDGFDSWSDYWKTFGETL